MKKFICTFLCELLLLAGIPCFAAAPITVTLDYAEIPFVQPPMIQNDRTLVPVRAVFEAMGAMVEWNEETKTITSVLDDTAVIMTLDSTTMLVNDAQKTLDCAPQLIDGSTFVPARAVAESFGYIVEWDGINRSVCILSPAFLEKTNSAEVFSSEKTLTGENGTVTSAFSISLLDGYDIKKNAIDGTDLEVSHTTDAGRAVLTVHSDIYAGADVPLTEEYVQSVADSMVSLIYGAVISCDVLTLDGTEFMKIKYIAPRAVFDIQDDEAEITVYMCRKNGVVYTLTHAVYGMVDNSIVEDLFYMMQSIQLTAK
ncbi:MAG: copper amine oxidase N-terminal domain-containing protein [Clostridia bacterium]|nr:copper amine oxidase N-terminal domain-containing protein [Clostridia bacterium]